MPKLLPSPLDKTQTLTPFFFTSSWHLFPYLKKEAKTPSFPFDFFPPEKPNQNKKKTSTLFCPPCPFFLSFLNAKLPIFLFFFSFPSPANPHPLSCLALYSRNGRLLALVNQGRQVGADSSWNDRRSSYETAEQDVSSGQRLHG